MQVSAATAQPLKVLVVVGHPRRASLCAALAGAYAGGAREAGMQVRLLDLAELDFDPDLHTPSPLAQPLEPDLAQAWEAIAWADHLLLVFPAWWGVGPARLYGFLDRVLLPGKTFREEDGRYEGLLAGRTAHLITTMDMPPWVYRLIYRAPGHSAMKRAILGFCGIAVTRTLAFGPVRDSDAAQRAACWQAPEPPAVRCGTVRAAAARAPYSRCCHGSRRCGCSFIR